MNIIKAKMSSVLALVFVLCCFWFKEGKTYTYTALEDSWTTGIATVYGTGDGGNCYADTVVTNDFPFGDIVAVGSDLWSNGLGCGGCYAVKCIEGSNTDNCATQGCYTTSEVIVQAVDQCPECSNTHLDLSTNAYFQIKDSSCIIDIQFRRVTCPNMGNGIRVDIKGGSSAFWIAMYFREVQGYGELSKVEIRSSGSSTWISCPHTTGQGFWTCSSVSLTLPVSIRLTDSVGNVYTDTDTLTSYSGSHYMSGNFDVTGSGTPVTDDPTTTPDPVDAVTPDPVNAATPEPTTQQGGSGNIILTNQEGTQEWWLSFYVSDPGCGSITQVAIRDGNSYSSWNAMSTQYGYYYLDNAGFAFQTPIDVRITISGERKIFNDIITSFTAGETYDTGYDPCSSGSTTAEPSPSLVTPRPTEGQQVTPEPTPQPVDTVTTSASSEGAITITTHQNNQEWWFTIQVSDIDESCGNLAGVYAKGGDFTSYTEMLNTGWGINWYYLPNGGNRMSAPVSIQLVNSNGDTITNEDVITAMTGGVEYNFQYNFCTTGAMGSRTVVSEVSTQTPGQALSSSKKVVLTVSGQSFNYWVGIYLNNINCGAVSNVWFKDSNYYSDKWYEGTNLNNQHDTYGDEYELSANISKAFELPISIMIQNTNGNDITEYDLIDSYAMSQYTLESVCNNNSKNSSTMSSSQQTIVIVVVVISVLFIFICIGGLLYCKNKNNGVMGKQKVTEMNYYEPMLGKETNESGETPQI